MDVPVYNMNGGNLSGSSFNKYLSDGLNVIDQMSYITILPDSVKRAWDWNFYGNSHAVQSAAETDGTAYCSMGNRTGSDEMVNYVTFIFKKNLRALKHRVQKIQFKYRVYTGAVSYSISSYGFTLSDGTQHAKGANFHSIRVGENYTNDTGYVWSNEILVPDDAEKFSIRFQDVYNYSNTTQIVSGYIADLKLMF